MKFLFVRMEAIITCMRIKRNLVLNLRIYSSKIMVITEKYFISLWSRIFLAQLLVDGRGVDTNQKKALRIQKEKLLRMLGYRKKLRQIAQPQAKM